MIKNGVYETADEKNVKTVMLYADASDKLFYDVAAKVDKVSQEDLLDLFILGVTIVKSDVYYRPVAFKTNAIVGHDGTAAVNFKGV